MKVLKFGGTSVGTAERMKSVAKLINSDSEQKIVVLSAMSGTTNSLVEISDYFYKQNKSGALEKTNVLEEKYADVIEELFSDEKKKEKATEICHQIFQEIRAQAKGVFTIFEEKIVLAQGELLSTQLFQLYLEEKNINSTLIPALDYMRIDKKNEPDTKYIAENLTAILNEREGYDIYITQGYICRNFYGEIDNLQRGGSDYTASLVGAAMGASEIQIWTDIDGMHNNDPRIVEGTRPVPMLHFDEAAELAYFGAKILHPTCILPAKLHNIPVKLLNTMQPEAKGTVISNKMRKNVIEAVAAKDGITAIKIKSGRMLLAHGFLRKVFEIFETYETAIDMITTSEVGVSVTIDNTKRLDDILNELKKLGTVNVDKDMVIVCVVGDISYEQKGFQSKVLDSLKDVSIRMISYGGSQHNISFLVRAEDKTKTLQLLNESLF